jgi:hypothetical protein
MLNTTEEELGLAPLYPVRDFDGPLSGYIDSLYWQYRAMVCDAGIALWGKPVVPYGDIAEDGRDQLFWHLMTNSDDSKKELRRQLNPFRCAYLPRAWDVLERLSQGDPRICYWRTIGKRRRGRRKNLFVAPVDFSMCVVLEERPTTFMLKTMIPAPTQRSAEKLFRRAVRACEDATD